MQLLNNAQSLIMLALALAAIGAGVFAFVDALRNDAAAFASEGKQTKNFWLIALGIALAGLVGEPQPDWELAVTELGAALRTRPGVELSFGKTFCIGTSPSSGCARTSWTPSPPRASSTPSPSRP